LNSHLLWCAAMRPQEGFDQGGSTRVIRRSDPGCHRSFKQVVVLPPRSLCLIALTLLLSPTFSSSVHVVAAESKQAALFQCDQVLPAVILKSVGQEAIGSSLSLLWEFPRWFLVANLFAFFIEALLIVWLWLSHKRRQRTEKELHWFANLAREGNRHLAEVVANVPGIVWETLIDPVTNERKTTFISSQIQNILGYTPEEWLAAPAGFGFSLMPEEDRERTRRECDEVIRSQLEGMVQFRWRTKAGETIWMETHLSPMVDEQGKTIGLRGVSLDITERKHSIDQLRESEER